jgi:exodeoxyribonuclease-3
VLPMLLKLATWNINSVRLRIDLIRQLVATEKPDVLCLQEIKCENGQFPLDVARELGFAHCEIMGQRGYHGVATLSRLPLKRLCALDFNGTGEARHLAVGVGAGKGAFVLHNVYVPSGGDVPDVKANDKFRQKLEHLKGLEAWCKTGKDGKGKRMLLVGDLNVAPLEHDVWSHKQLVDVVSHTPIEVEHLAGVMNAGAWHDLMRAFVPATEKLYTWWSYRAKDWRAANRGRRLDHVWATPALAGVARSMKVLDGARSWEKPSDHVPVIVELDAA